MYPNHDTARRMIESAFGAQPGPDPFSQPELVQSVQCQQCGQRGTYAPPVAQPGAALPVAIYLQCCSCGTLYRIA